jgi:hypothetical protein
LLAKQEEEAKARKAAKLAALREREGLLQRPPQPPAQVTNNKPEPAQALDPRS